ncbi:hypothetical protein MG293_012209 [Ovis ammon polii]|uniref:Thioesterase domain-containing protein n=1 Tax=Ovis ammon polii TaxID=230172 RepID=A0AAD4U2J9_OVIAM|nr:hypothetical protein MG293_012209 [Ovis ammon polii]
MAKEIVLYDPEHSKRGTVQGSSPTMTSWVSRLLPRNGRSLATASENQRAEDRHRHQEAYGYFLPIQTRWQDNDQYGHVNNVVYYSYFDTIINQYLISPGAVPHPETGSQEFCKVKNTLEHLTVTARCHVTCIEAFILSLEEYW